MLRDMLKDNPGGKTSMMRVCTLVIVGSIMVVYLTHNIIAIIKGAGMVSIGWQEVSLIGGALGFKAYQVSQEDSPTPPSSNDMTGGDETATAPDKK